jgi:NAD(P)H dehydrogenase (quinone)
VKHAVILCQPSAKSFNAAVARTYAAAVRASGDEVIVRNIYAMGYNPCLADQEIPRPEGFAPGADVVADADVFAFV